MTAVTARVAEAASRVLARRVDRRGLLTRAAVVGSAVTTSGLDYILKPGSAYASVCGSGNSCYSGWTAMCCTINHGVNQCPPGSFAGGWWKADGAGLCGGHARYYIDCQAECTKCGCGGGAFCSSRCWNCRSHCADGSCDKRHVCHNVFRYGQCERDRHCGGPVLCRAISCTPPWKWANCSSASATDNATRTHSASCLPRWSPIAHRYTALGSQGSALGATVHAEYETDHVRVQRYEHGRMYHTTHTGSHYLVGDLASVYRHEGEMRSPLGLPTSDPTSLDDGRVVYCQHGGIYQRHGAHAHAIWGAIYRAWTHDGSTTGRFGYPTTSCTKTAGGIAVHFQHGAGYDGPATPVHLLTNPIAAVYRQLAEATGALGWPTTDVTVLPDGVGSRAGFQNGEILNHPGYGTHGLWGLLDAAYQRHGADAGPLGYPTGDVTARTAADGSAGSVITAVDGVVTVLDGATSAYAVWSHVYVGWARDGGLDGALGYPIADMTVDNAGNQRGLFQHGTVTYDAASGQTTVTPTA